MKVYAAMYNPMIHESTWGIISLHETRKGAEMALSFHKENERKRWLSVYSKKTEPYEFGKFENWTIDELEILKP